MKRNAIKHGYTPQFVKNYKKLPPDIKNKATKKEQVFFGNPYHSSLKTHKLLGKYKNYWSFSVDYHYRIVFKFVSSKEVTFLDIGTYRVYKIYES